MRLGLDFMGGCCGSPPRDWTLVRVGNSPHDTCGHFQRPCHDPLGGQQQDHWGDPLPQVQKCPRWVTGSSFSRVCAWASTPPPAPEIKLSSPGLLEFLMPSFFFLTYFPQPLCIISQSLRFGWWKNALALEKRPSPPVGRGEYGPRSLEKGECDK